MPKYGIINEDGSMYTSSKHLEGYKEIKYEKIPEDFDQTTHYVTQEEAVDKGDYLYVGIEINELEQDDEFEDDIF